ncbi:MAG: hypothetical protein AAFN50_00430 [Pseudomonadota bacterium]
MQEQSDMFTVMFELRRSRPASAFGVPLFILLTAGCASAPPPEPVAAFHSRDLAYTHVALEFIAPGAGSQSVALTDGGDGMAEGAKMLAVAPVECLRGADPYTAAFCIGLAPFFPFIAAWRVQDEAISIEQLETLYEYLAAFDVHSRFADELRRQAATAALPVVDEANADSVILRVWLGPTTLIHSGYKDSDIGVSMPYRIELINAAREVLVTIAGEFSDDFDVNTWQDENEPDTALTRWTSRTVTKVLQATLVEWQPKLVLAPVQPMPVNKRSIIGIMQERWPVVESVRPQMAWQSLGEVLHDELRSQISDVTYELRISGRYSGKTFYEIVGLLEPSHALLTDLEPCASYIWQPRARFRYRNSVYTTSLRDRQWSPELRIPYHYTLNTPGPGCKDASYP